MTTAAAIFDLDRTVLRASSTPVIQRHLAGAGLVSRTFPAEKIFQQGFELFGESPLGIRLARNHTGAMPGWTVEQIAAISEQIADELLDMVQPFVPSMLAGHRDEGRVLVLATASNLATIEPLANRLGFDHVIATRWAVDGGRYTGALDGKRLSGREKCGAVLTWASENGVDLDASFFYTDSSADIDLLEAVGNPVAVNPDVRLAVTATRKRWPIRFLDKPDGVVKMVGRELQDWGRPFARPELDPMAKIEIEGLDNIPDEGAAIVVFNHRSYYDGGLVGQIVSRSGRAARFLGKKEVFDVPVMGAIGKALGGIRVDRGTGSDEPLQAALAALAGGDVIAMAPEGTIPRGPAFFEPDLKGRWGAAKLAIASGAPVVPVGLWGTEKVWPRSSRMPRFPLPGQSKPTVTVSVGKPFAVEGTDPDAVTAQIMDRIVAQLPAEARVRKDPTPEELARTYPPGYSGDPDAEADRRPGTDT